MKALQWLRRVLTDTMCATTIRRLEGWEDLTLPQRQAYPVFNASSCSGSASLAGCSGDTYAPLISRGEIRRC